MTLPRLSAAIVLALLLAAPAALAAPQVAELESSHLEAFGAATVGGLAALEAAPFDVDDVGQPGATGEMRLAAAGLDVLVEEETAMGAAGTANPNEDGWTAKPHPPVHHSDVRDGVVALDLLHRVYVFPLDSTPLPQARPLTGCAALAPSPVAEIRSYNNLRNAGAHERHQERSDVRSAAVWQETDRCGAAGWTIEGSFLLILWEADLTFHHASGVASYTAGAERAPRAPAVPAPPPVGTIDTWFDETNRQVYLTVRDGRLDVLAPRTAVFLSGVQLQAGALHVDDGRGEVSGLEGRRLLSGEDLDLAGDLEVRVAPAQGRLPLRVTGRLDGAAVDGQTVTIAPASAFGPSAWMAALMLAPVAVAGCAAAWRRGPVRSLARLEGLALMGQHREVARRSGRLQRLPDLGGEATALRVEALARLGDVQGALAEARRLPPMESELARAYAHALSGDHRACVAALRACGELDAGWARLALRDPAFARARRDPALRSLVGRSAGGPA